MCVHIPVSDLGDAAIFGHVYLWGASGSWNNTCGPNRGLGAATGGPCDFVDVVDVAQFVGFGGLLVLTLIGILGVRPRSAAGAGWVLIALSAMSLAQSRILAPRWSDAILVPPWMNPAFVALALVLVLARRERRACDAPSLGCR